MRPRSCMSKWSQPSERAASGGDRAVQGLGFYRVGRRRPGQGPPIVASFPGVCISDCRCASASEFGKDRGAGEVDEFNSGSSNCRGCAHSTDYGGTGSSAHRGADYPAPQVVKDIVQVVQIISRKSASRSMFSQLVDVPVFLNLEEIVELVRKTSATADPPVIVDVTVPQIMEEMSR